MAKKDAYYFSHDANAQDDPKCMVLIDQLGVEGYGIFWLLVEKLRAESEYKLPLIVLESFAKRWGTSKEKVNAVVKNYNLFVIENDEFFYSKRLTFSMNMKSEKAKTSIKARWDKQKELQSNTNVLETNTIEILNDTIKVKESKVKESNYIGFKNPTLNDCIELFKTKTAFNWTEQYAVKSANIFYNFYESKNWMVGKNKMKSLAHAVSGWIARDDKAEKQETKETETERKMREWRERGF